ncbi:MAG: GIY-YIG nuclease family protein [bacterium]|nr:GIY-YIG nuclease family protein [bacterium]
MARRFFVYILASRSRTLYVGVTSNPRQRMLAHRRGEGSEFTKRYHIHHLVRLEGFARVRDALLREKQIKGWLRSKKLRLIEEQNPEWRDLSWDLWSI